MTLPLHLLREATVSSISGQPPAPWSQRNAVISTPRISDSVSNPRSPRKPKTSPRKPQNITTLQSLEENLKGKAEPEDIVQPYDDSKRRKKKKNILAKANSRKSKINDKNIENDDDTDVPPFDINDELNSSRRLYASVYEILQKQEDTLSSVLNKDSVGRGREITERQRQIKRHSSSTSSRASTPVKHSLQVNDPQSCITPRSNTISTVQ